MKLYMVNEKPDGSGRWLWDDDWMYATATLHVQRGSAQEAADGGGHVVEFTMSEDHSWKRETRMAICLGLGCPPPPGLSHDEAVKHIRDHFDATRHSDCAAAWKGALMEVGEAFGLEWDRDYGSAASLADAIREHFAAKPEPREPDAIMVCADDGSPDWNDVWPAGHPRLSETDVLDRRKVYLDTPPPAGDDSLLDDLLDALGWDGGNFHEDAIAEVKRLKEDRGDALEEVSRLSKALDEARRERDMQSRIANGFATELDELSKQKPVAWRTPLGGQGWAVTEQPDSVDGWRQHGFPVENLYAAPKPGDKVVSGPSNTPASVLEALNTCMACNHTSPGTVGPVHTCEPAPARDWEAYGADTPAMVHPAGFYRAIGRLEGLAAWAKAADHENKATTAELAIEDIKAAMRALGGGK